MVVDVVVAVVVGARGATVVTVVVGAVVDVAGRSLPALVAPPHAAVNTISAIQSDPLPVRRLRIVVLLVRPSPPHLSGSRDIRTDCLRE